MHHLNSSFCKDRTSPDYSAVFCLFINVFMNSTGRLFHRFMARKLFLITLGSVPLTCNIFIFSYSLQLLLLSQLVGSFFLFFFFSICKGKVHQMWGTGNLSAPCKGLIINSNIHAMSWVQPWHSNRCFLMVNVPNLWLGRKFHTSVLRAKNWNLDMHQKWFNSLKLLSKHCSHGLH